MVNALDTAAIIEQLRERAVAELREAMARVVATEAQFGAARDEATALEHQLSALDAALDALGRRNTDRRGGTR